MIEKSSKSLFLFAIPILFVFLFSGFAMGEEDIVVYAPKGLKSVMSKIESEFEKDYDITVKTVFLIHQDLKKTIKARGGDLLLSVYPDLDVLKKDVGDIMENPIKVAYHEPLIYIWKENPKDIREFNDLGKPDIRLIIRDRKGKPYVGLVERTIDKSSISKEIKNNTVKSYVNGNEVLRSLIAGEGDAAISLKSLSTWDEFKNLETINVPNAIKEVDEIFISELTSSKLLDKLKVIKYVDFVLSTDGKKIFLKYGYSIPR